MGCLGRDANQVSGRDLLANTALNRAIALLVRRNRFSVNKCAAYKECRGAGLHENNVRLRFMPLRLTVGFTMNQQGSLVGKIRELFDSEMVRIGRCLLR